MDIVCNNNTLEVIRDKKFVFELSLSRNNIVRCMRIGKFTCCHSFDEDYDYDHDTQRDWETHGKLSKKKLNDVVDNIDTAYEFYYSNEFSAKFIHTSNCFTIMYNAWEFGDDVHDICMFTSEEFSMFKNELKNLISS